MRAQVELEAAEKERREAAARELGEKREAYAMELQAPARDNDK